MLDGSPYSAPFPWQCTTNSSYTLCEGIPANPDLSGVGVRVAFYFQSLTNAVLVVFSPRESVAVAWAGAFLSSALVIAGIVSKFTHNLTLYHADLIMNFTTLLCVSSLATAPKLPVWRRGSAKANEARKIRVDLRMLYRTFVKTSPTAEPRQLEAFERVDSFLKRQYEVSQEKQQEGKKIIASALLVQTVAQWTWCLILVAHPKYSSCECSGSTVLVLFLAPFKTKNINSFDAVDAGALYLVWLLWLLTCLGSTLGLVAYLSIVGPPPELDTSMVNAPRASTRSQRPTGGFPRQEIQRRDVIIVLVNACAFIFWAILIASSEWQRKLNNVADNNISGFGQIIALLAAMVPVWSVWEAISKYRAGVGEEPPTDATQALNGSSEARQHAESEASGATEFSSRSGRTWRRSAVARALPSRLLGHRKHSSDMELNSLLSSASTSPSRIHSDLQYIASTSRTDLPSPSNVRHREG